MTLRFLLIAGLSGTLAFAQDPEGDLDLLQKLLATPVIAANLQLTPIRESPAILTVISQGEIRASGARDLIDLLKMVPGLDFASDTQGVVGLGVRGNWGHDGKVLLLIDGLEMTEPLYGTLQFGTHYPIGDIDRIEIIRGPGSAIYGQFAELAVINILTRRDALAEGSTAQLWAGGMAGASPMAVQGQLTFGKTWGDQGLTIAYAGGEVPEGSGPWPTAAGPVQAGHLGGVHQDFLNLGYSLGELRVRYIRDGYSLYDYTQEAGNGTPARQLSFDGQFVGVDYRCHLGDWEFRPSFTLKDQQPWTYTAAHTDKDTRGVAKLLATWKAAPGLALTFGGEATQDDANIYWSSRQARQDYVYQNRAFLAQLLWSTPAGNLDLGVRTDHNSEYGSVTSPRIAYTKATEEWHFKLLLAEAFRAPSIEDLFVNPALRPERTHSYEAEAGLALSSHSYLSANLFIERISEPIAYSEQGPGGNTYLNFDHVGSRGLELTLRSQFAQFSWQGAFTFLTADDGTAPSYTVPGASGYQVGFPRVKLGLMPVWRFMPGWSLRSNLLCQGPRYAYAYGDTLPSRLGPTTTVDFFLNHAVTEHLDVGLRAMNVFNAYNPFIQPYGTPGQGGDPPLPGRQRELDLKVALRF